MSKLKPVLILCSLIIAKLVLGCGMFARNDSSLHKSFLMLNVKMVGLPLLSKYVAKPENFSLTVSGCLNEKLNGIRNIQLSAEKKIIELAGKTDGCKFVLNTMRLLEQSQSIVCDSSDPEGPLSVLSGEIRVFECGETKKFEVIVERGIPETNQDVYDVSIGVKPIFVAIPAYSGATYTDSEPENADGMLYLSNIKYVSSSRDKKHNHFIIEFACPDLMRASMCEGTQWLRQPIVLLDEGERKLDWNSLAAVAKQEKRHVLVKRDNITESGIKFLINIGTWENNTLGVLLIDGERLRLFQIDLPEKREN